MALDLKRLARFEATEAHGRTKGPLSKDNYLNGDCQGGHNEKHVPILASFTTGLCSSSKECEISCIGRGKCAGLFKYQTIKRAIFMHYCT